MFHNISFNFATAISKFDTFSSYHSTIGISMYQQSILPYIIIPSTFSTQASSPLDLERSRQTEGQRNFFTPCSLSFFFSTERVGPYPQAQL